MDIKAKINNLNIIHSGFGILISKEDRLRIKIKTDNGLNFEIYMIFNDIDSVKSQNMATRVNNDVIEIHCLNFNNPSGTGVSQPIDLATVGDKHLYLVFWVYALGGNSKKIEYIFLMEE